MLNLLDAKLGPLKVNGVEYPHVLAARMALKDFEGEVSISLNYKKESLKMEPPVASEKPSEKPVLMVTVKQWMTKKATPDFDFMAKWNNDQPMPMRRMYGEVLEETKGMVKMKLHGRAEKNAVRCSHCLRELTHPVSRYYGIGPICGGHFHMATPEALERAGIEEDKIFEVADRKLREVTWEGWIIKSAILEEIKVGAS